MKTPREHLLLVIVALYQDTSGLGLFPKILAQRPVEQLLRLLPHQTLPLHRRAAFHTQPPDAAVLVVAARVAEVHFAVVDDRVAPVGDVERAVGAELHINGAEGGIGCLHEDGQLFGHVS